MIKQLQISPAPTLQEIVMTLNQIVIKLTEQAETNSIIEHNLKVVAEKAHKHSNGKGKK